MKTKKLLEKLKGHLNAERREQLSKYDSIKKILRKLKKKEIILKEQLNDEDDEEVREQLQKELDVIFAQRQKGVGLKKELKAAREA